MTDLTIQHTQTLNEKFGAFWKKRKTRAAPIKSPEDVHDEHTDAVMHHLHQIHKLTHSDSDWHRAIKKMGGNSTYVKDMHKHVGELIHKFGE